MTDFIKKVSDATGQVNESLDKVALRIEKALRIEDPLKIMPYMGYGTPDWLYVKGRVLQNEGIESLPEDASVVQNVKNMYLRFESDEIPNAKVKICVGDCKETVEANKEGFFEATLRPSMPMHPTDHWQSVYFELMDPPPRTQPAVNATGQARVVPPQAKFGVISDIDDTVVYTAAKDPLKMVRIAYLGNAHSRRPFAGVDPFYDALVKGKVEERKEEAGNPIFYVSSSPWNMYDLFDNFLDLNDIPNGPILLRDIELSPANLLSFDHAGHKREQIDPILTRYPELPFILFGDSGQKDAEIYSQLIEDYPDRILAVYIRDAVPDNKQRHEEIDAIANKIRATGVEFLLFSDTIEAARHAESKGWIEKGRLAEIESDPGV